MLLASLMAIVQKTVNSPLTVVESIPTNNGIIVMVWVVSRGPMFRLKVPVYDLVPTPVLTVDQLESEK